MEANAPSAPRLETTDGARKVGRSSRRVWWLVAAALVAGANTVIALGQPLRPDPFATPKPTELAWWLSPPERNAFRRLTVIAANLNDVAAAPGTEKLWAVGDSGMIVHSPDGGRTWTQPQEPGAIPESPTPRPAQRRSLGPRLVPDAEAEQAPSQGVVVVPSLEKRSVEDAADLLGKFQLRLAGSDPKEPLQRRDIVIRQRPEPGTRVPPGTTVVVDVLRVPSESRTGQVPVQQQAPPPTSPAAPPTPPEPSPSAPPPRAEPTPPAPVEKENAPSLRGTPPPVVTPARPLERPDLFGVYFSDEKRGWAVGELGTILATDDGGKSWKRQASPVSADLHSVRFLRDGQRGWAVGASGTIVATPNGGGSWERLPSPTPSGLRAMHAADDGSIWAVGAGGIILASPDGGKSWARQTISPAVDLSAVHVLPDKLRGWAAGEQGTIVTTSTGGRQWQPQSSGTAARLRAIRFAADGRQGWAVGDDGLVLTTTNGGASWDARRHDTNAELRSIHLTVDGRSGCVVGAGGTVLTASGPASGWTRRTGGQSVVITGLSTAGDDRVWAATAEGIVLSTSGSGRSWLSRSTGSRTQLNDVFFLRDGAVGWLVGADGNPLVSRDAGVTWQPSSGPGQRMTSVHFTADGLRGWATASDGRILATPDGGATWAPQDTPGGTSLRRVRFDAAGRYGWAIGGKGTMRFTSDGGARWQTQSVAWPAGGAIDLFDVHVKSDGSRAWIVGDRGTVLVVGGGGAPRMSQVTEAKLPLRSVHFDRDGQRGWVVGSSGTILTTPDGGEQWRPQKSGTSLPLGSVRFLDDGRRGWAAGRGAILATVDGGATWAPVTHAAWPAPWYYASWLLVVGLLLPALKRPAPQPAAERSVADLLVSDRPLEMGDPDPLGFGNVARGLSRFLRNEQTQPPLTIAVTGAWGSGKSSLMNLVRGDLQRRGFRPVWFNAWHHQKEEHLLAAMLQNVHAQAVPPWYSWGGLAFRTRLLWYRGGRRWRLVLPLLLLVSAAAGYLVADHPARKDSALVATEGIVDGGVNIFAPLFPGGVSESLKRANEALGPRFRLARAIPTGLALVVLLLMFYRGMSAFGVSPADLVTSVSGWTRRRTFEAKMGFRHEFAREFSDVTRALNPRTMLILIDDLDRCRPEHVLEVLEAVNFLVSSGDCFVVMGMELDRVRRCVGLGFKDVAAELTDAEEAATPETTGIAGETDEGKRRRAVFAQQYLEKLINIEVAVPTPTESQAARVIAPDAEPAPAAGRWVTLGTDLARLGRLAMPVAAVLAAVALGFWGAMLWWPPTAPAPAGTVIAALAGQEGGRPISPPAEPTPAPSERFRDRPVVADGDVAAPARWLAWPVVLVVLAGAIIALLNRPSIVVKDSDEFTTALAVWHPLVFMRSTTPRSAKRFVNRVRYYAMRQRDVREDRPIDRLATWLTPWRERPTEERAGEPGSENIPERLLVALSAIEHAHGDWLASDAFFRDPTGFLAKQPLPATLKKALDRAPLGDELARYRQAFGKLSSTVHV